MAAGDRIRNGSASETPFQRPSGRVSFPHRTSLDLTTEQYEWLREISWQNRESASGFLRLIIDRLMTDEALLEKVVQGKK